jgi:hypothetical protein
MGAFRSDRSWTCCENRSEWRITAIFAMGQGNHARRDAAIIHGRKLWHKACIKRGSDRGLRRTGFNSAGSAP